MQIRVYANRVTIANDCRLSEGTTLADLATAHKSVAINPLVAGAMFRSGQIEAWGRGLERIINLCVADKLPKPDFIITPRTFTINFHTRENPMTESAATDEAANAGVVETGHKAGQKGGLKSRLKGGLKSSLKIMQIMSEIPEISLPEIAERLGMVRSSIAKQVKKLKAQGHIRRVGPDKGGHWEVFDRDAESPQVSR